MSPRGSSRLRANGARRRRGWSLGPGGTGVTNVTTSSSAFLGSVSQATLDGLTVARIRGRFTMVAQILTALGDGFQGAIGIGIANENAIGVGITAVNLPITDASWDGWLYHQFVSIHRGVTANSDGSGVLDFEVDTKAMRKMNAGDSLYACIELVEIGTADVDVFFDSRALFLLP